MSHARGFALCAGILLGAGCVPARQPTPAAELNVLVYNVHAGKDGAGRGNIQRVADIVKDSRADIALLQEVDKGTRRSGGVDQPAEYARHTGYHVAFGRSLFYDGGEYGIAVLSRWPIRWDTTIDLRVDPPQERAGGSREPRVVMLALIAAPIGDMLLLNTHLDASRDDRWRRMEIRTIIEVVRSPPGPRAEHMLVGGDLNATPESAVQLELLANGLDDAWLRCGSGDGFTFRADSLVKRIDYLYLTGGARCSRATVLATDASDHHPVLVSVQFAKRR